MTINLEMTNTGIHLITLSVKKIVQLKPKPPFNFDGTFYKPSHFPTPIVFYEKGKFWQTIRFNDKVFGLKFENKGNLYSPQLDMTIYSSVKLSKHLERSILNEINWRYGFDEDVSKFYKNFKSDELLGPVLKRWRGVHLSCAYSLYELAIITIMLQNATVRRSTDMLASLLETYGGKVSFDGHTLYVFWEPSRLAKVSEEELKSLKVGYRAKFLKAISQVFVEKKIDQDVLKGMNDETAKKHLLGLKGIGPASAQILLIEYLKRYNAFDIIPPWDQKIYSKLLFNKSLVPVKRILGEAERRWGSWKALAMHYLWENLFWKRKATKINWLEKIIRL